jgi:hypothetical protein
MDTPDFRKVMSNLLVEYNKCKPVLYFAYVHNIDTDHFVINIGTSLNLELMMIGRDNIDIFKVWKSPHAKQIQELLYDHPFVSQHKYNYQGNDETFKVNQNDIDEIIKLTSNFYVSFDKKVNPPDGTELGFFIDERRHTQTRGEKVQRYSPDGMTLIKTYESFAFALRDDEILDLSRSGMMSAIKNNLVYKGFRWAELERDHPDDHFQTLITCDSSSMKKGFVAMLNLEQNLIVNVFCDQKAAAEDRKFKGCAAISAAISRGNRSGGHYFKMWNECSKELQETYLLTHVLPEKRILSTHKRVQQIHPMTDDCIKTFSCTEDVVTQFKLSRITLKYAIETNTIAKGFKWRFMNNES